MQCFYRLAAGRDSGRHGSMLFNSYTFIFAFLPITLLGFFALAGRVRRRVVVFWLVVCSAFFYGWARPENLLLLGVLLVANYGLGVYLCRHSQQRRGRIGLAVGVTGNLAVLGYFKYANFFLNTLSSVTGASWSAADIVLPLGISFFIFQKIAYLVDAYRGQVRGYNFIDYCLFVMFFPQLIAGPIVHHAEVMPQIANNNNRLNAADLSVGLAQFVFGLFKKVIIADRMALYASPIFNAAHAGITPTFLDGWIAALAYTFQLYFDFSGYTDMALGLGRMFGIRLPLNFNSPYKSANITDFWRRWHMTLSRFLRDYLYIPLGGNRKGVVRQNVNLMLTMLLGGLWHGAGWTFVFWGGLHGLYLVIHHAWSKRRPRLGVEQPPPSAWRGYGARTLTFFAVLVGWVIFRAQDFATAREMLGAMFGLSGFDFTSSRRLEQVIPWLTVLWVIVWWFPNTQEILARFQPALDFHPKPGDIETGRLGRWNPQRYLSWNATIAWAVVLAGVTVYTISQMSRVSEFIYWQF